MKVIAWDSRAALLGLLCVLPFFIINFIVSFRIEPFYALLGSFPILRSTPIFPLMLLLFLPVGALVAIHPMLFSGKDGVRKMPILNTILSVLVLAMFLFIFIGLAEDIYKCQMLKIPNCD